MLKNLMIIIAAVCGSAQANTITVSNPDLELITASSLSGVTEVVLVPSVTYVTGRTSELFRTTGLTIRSQTAGQPVTITWSSSVAIRENGQLGDRITNTNPPNYTDSTPNTYIDLSFDYQGQEVYTRDASSNMVGLLTWGLNAIRCEWKNAVSSGECFLNASRGCVFEDCTFSSITASQGSGISGDSVIKRYRQLPGFQIMPAWSGLLVSECFGFNRIIRNSFSQDVGVYYDCVIEDCGIADSGPAFGQQSVGDNNHLNCTIELALDQYTTCVTSKACTLYCGRGDFDGDGVVGFSDNTLILASWGQPLANDPSGNGVADFADLLVINNQWDCTWID